MAKQNYDQLAKGHTPFFPRNRIIKNIALVNYLV